MTEYIFMALFIIAIFALSSFLRVRYLKKSKWEIIVMDILAFLLIFFLFIIGHKGETETGFSNFKTLLIIFTVVYFAYKIYKDIRLLKTK